MSVLLNVIPDTLHPLGREHNFEVIPLRCQQMVHLSNKLRYPVAVEVIRDAMCDALTKLLCRPRRAHRKLSGEKYAMEEIFGLILAIRAVPQILFLSPNYVATIL
jgi:hypothetical protein